MKRWAALFGFAILVIVILADTRHLGFLAAVYAFPNGDKVGHFALFGVLSFLVNMAALERWSAEKPARVALGTSAALAVLIGLEELSQRWFPARTSSWADLAASYLGVALSAWVALRISRRGIQKPEI